MKKANSKHLSNTIGPSSLGQKIEAARKNKRLSQVKLSEMLGVSRASVSLYETGSGHPSYKVLNKLAEVLGVPFMELAGLDHGGDDYPGVMITKHILESSNDDRAGFIKEHLGRDETYVEVDFMGKPIHALKLISSSSEVNQNDVDVSQVYEKDKHVQWPTVSVLALSGIDYSNARVYIVEDNKQGPRYPKSSRHILHPIVNKSSWQYLTGLHGVSISGESTIIRRIVSNKANHIILADAAGNEITVSLDNVEAVWKVGQAIHMPAED